MKDYFYYFLYLSLFMMPSLAFANEQEQPVFRKVSIPGYYALGYVYTDNKPDDESAASFLRKLRAEWNLPRIQIAWFRKNTSKASLLLVGESGTDSSIAIIHPKNTNDTSMLEKYLAFPTTPAELYLAYTENAVLADDNFKGKSVIFMSVVGEIARGAFNKPYVFFRTFSDPNTGLTCYFDPNDQNLRQIRKGSQVIVRGDVKGFLMQDIILEHCTILSISEQ